MGKDTGKRTPSPKTTTNNPTKKQGELINLYSKSGQLLSYQNQNENLYAIVSYEDMNGKYINAQIKVHN